MKPLLVSKIEKNAGDVDTNANYCTDIEGIQLFVDTLLIKVLKSILVSVLQRETLCKDLVLLHDNHIVMENQCCG